MGFTDDVGRNGPAAFIEQAGDASERRANLVLDALKAKLPEGVADKIIDVKFEGQKGTFAITTPPTFSRSNLAGLGLVEGADFNIAGSPVCKFFNVKAASLENALGIVRPSLGLGA